MEKYRNISDYRIVALLLYNDIQYENIVYDNSKGKKKLFVFNNERQGDKITQIIEDFGNGKINVNLRDYLSMLDRVKDIINSL